MGPLQTPPPNYIPMSQISMRDHFAGLALQGLITILQNKSEQTRLTFEAHRHKQTLAQFLAEESYKQADAMIEARTQPVAYGPAKESK